MAGVFSKGGGVPLTPAQQLVQKNALTAAQNSANVFLPVQQVLDAQTQEEQPGLQSMGRGQTAATMRTAGSASRAARINSDSNAGASIGSGRSLLDMTKGSNATATNTGMGLTQATAAGQQHYVRGLQEIIGMGQKTQAQAQSGLQTAANAQAQEAGAQQAATAQTQQGVGQLAGLAIAAF